MNIAELWFCHKLIFVFNCQQIKLTSHVVGGIHRKLIYIV